MRVGMFLFPMLYGVADAPMCGGLERLLREIAPGCQRDLQAVHVRSEELLGT